MIAKNESSTTPSLPRKNSADALAIGEILVKAGVVSKEQIAICLAQQANLSSLGRTVFIEQLLVRNRFASQRDIAQAIQRATGGGQTGLFQTILPPRICKQYHVYPLRYDNGTLMLKTARPLSDSDIRAIKAHSHLPVKEVEIIPTDIPEIFDMLSRVMKSEYSFSALLERMKGKTLTGAILRQAIHALLAEAIEMRSSDIHLDRKDEYESYVGYRVDGNIVMEHLVPQQLMSAIFTRIKTESGMDASETRRAQDGRLNFEVNGRLIDFRIATQPLVSGYETMTMRVLDPESLLGLEELFPGQPVMTELFHKIGNVDGKNGGLILFSGPTGSGKTTSLYALAQMFPRDKRNVLTVEDPVEYVLPFARQIQLNQLLGEKSIGVERSMLRQDPDVLIIGEIRDADTMNAALRFAESGHLVLASVHARDTMQTIERFMSFAQHNERDKILYMLANTLRVVVNQRLVPRLCTCATDEYNPHPDEGKIHKHAVGCVKCRNTGYRGRVASHETLVISMDSAVRQTVTTLLFESFHNVNQLKGMEGVFYRDRKTTLTTLYDAGIIDELMVNKEINQDLV